MRSNFSYLEYLNEGKKYKIAHKNIQTSSKWIFFMQFAVKYSLYVHMQDNYRKDNEILLLNDNVISDELDSKRFYHKIISQLQYNSIINLENDTKLNKQ